MLQQHTQETWWQEHNYTNSQEHLRTRARISLKPLVCIIVVCRSVVMLLEYLSTEWRCLGAALIDPSGLGVVSSFLVKMQIWVVCGQWTTSASRWRLARRSRFLDKQSGAHQTDTVRPGHTDLVWRISPGTQTRPSMVHLSLSPSNLFGFLWGLPCYLDKHNSM
jgi:hypothetical protein